MKDTVFARRSIRRFKQIPVTKEQIQALLDAALVAPSARNGQLLRYCVVSSPEKLKEVFNNTAWAGYVHPKRIPLRDVSSPMLFIVVSAVKNEQDVSPHTWADAGAAIENMLFSGDETVSTASAQKKLEDARVLLKYKVRRGGKISELQDKIELLKSRRDSAETVKNLLSRKENEKKELVSIDTLREQIRAEM